MDPSALIFVALAVAWAVYLVPKALKHHDDAVRSRSVERFSHTMRVLARREPVDARQARLVVTPGRPASRPIVAAKAGAAMARSVASTVTETVTETVHTSVRTTSAAAPAAPADPAATAESSGSAASDTAPRPTQTQTQTPGQARARRAAAQRAARRRRRVLGLVLLANAVVITLAALAVVGWAWEAVPATLLVAWLVACRLMVRQERGIAGRQRTPRPRRSRRPAAQPGSSDPDASATQPEAAEEEFDWTVDTSSMPAAIVDPTLWDPVPVTLPTYVTKPTAARRTVRTIDLDSTGVWTSGRTEADAQLARQADEAQKADRARRDEQQAPTQRAVGS